MTKDKNHTEQAVSGAMTDFVQWLNTQRDLPVRESFHEIVAHVTVLTSSAQDAQAVRNAALREAAQYIKDMGEPLFIEEGILDLQSAPAQPVEIPDVIKLLDRIDDEYCATGDLGIETLRMIRAAIAANQTQQNRVINEAVSMPSDTPHVAYRWVSEQRVFGYFHELLDHEGKGTGVWLGCPNRESVEKSHIEGETGNEIVTLFTAPQVEAKEELLTQDAAINDFVEGYEVDAGEGIYTPTEHERFLIDDAIRTFLADQDYYMTAASQVEAKEEYKLAPVEPTEAMIEAGNNVGNDVVATYSAMLAAAPSSQKEGGQ